MLLVVMQLGVVYRAHSRRLTKQFGVFLGIGCVYGLLVKKLGTLQTFRKVWEIEDLCILYILVLAQWVGLRDYLGLSC